MAIPKLFIAGLGNLPYLVTGKQYGPIKILLLLNVSVALSAKDCSFSSPIMGL
jgi:hypothetical protein